MNLNDRKLCILNAIITEYISSSEPIGSRTIARQYDIGVSPATIRNEMSDLEEMGLIVQPHTSSGRIPSDKGYRVYVDEILSKGVLQSDVEVISSMINKNLKHIDYLMQETAKMVSSLTNYVTIIREPSSDSLNFKHIQFSLIDKSSLLLTMVMENSTIKNKIIDISSIDFDENVVPSLSDKLNNLLKGKSIVEITKEDIQDVRDDFDSDTTILIPILKEIASEFSKENDYQVYTSGTDKIFNYPEFNNTDNAVELFKTLEEKQILLTLLGEDDSDSLQILIGSENTQEQLKNFSIVKSQYKVGKSKGCISVIGPKRMEYTNTINTVTSVTKLLEQLLEKK